MSALSLCSISQTEYSFGSPDSLPKRLLEASKKVFFSRATQDFLRLDDALHSLKTILTNLSTDQKGLDYAIFAKMVLADCSVPGYGLVALSEAEISPIWDEIETFMKRKGANCFESAQRLIDLPLIATRLDLGCCRLVYTIIFNILQKQGQDQKEMVADCFEAFFQKHWRTKNPPFWNQLLLSDGKVLDFLQASLEPSKIATQAVLAYYYQRAFFTMRETVDLLSFLVLQTKKEISTTAMRILIAQLQDWKFEPPLTETPAIPNISKAHWLLYLKLHTGKMVHKKTTEEMLSVAFALEDLVAKTRDSVNQD